MYTIMPQTPPPFSFGRPGQFEHRPSFSSPLSSSPMRASSASPPPQQQQQRDQPLSPCGPNYLNSLPRQRQTQSSPIFPTGGISPVDQNSGTGHGNPKFRFASRNPRPNPVLRRREDAQESRRRLFFQNVRQRQEDKRWEMRGGEDELLKLEWWRLHRERHQAKEAEVAQYLGPMLDADVAAREEEDLKRARLEQTHPDADLDAQMADAIAQQEEAEVQALIASLEGTGQGRESLYRQQQFSDDEDYDGLFMDLIEQQEGDGALGMGHSQDVEMS